MYFSDTFQPYFQQSEACPSTVPTPTTMTNTVNTSYINGFGTMNPHFLNGYTPEGYFANFPQVPLHPVNPLSPDSPYNTSSNYTSPVSIDQKRPKKKKPRNLFQKSQLDAMNEVFKRETNPKMETLTRLQAVTRLTKKQIKIWFQNRRYKEKKGLQAKTSASVSPRVKDDEEELPTVFDQNMNFNNTAVNNMMNMQQDNFFYNNHQFMNNWTPPPQSTVYPPTFPAFYNGFTEPTPMTNQFQSSLTDQL
ncbi:unnamed protein product [Bursaphelenchus okinawaensis]|uniref:Homeobox domain-containing protein n=1 Tax=Bursaphelenchus okinawaensis TaxID=465554 RepID=A0A811L9E1_9BILA|nr:unnamed protein product [Bursaphelenchus okinawaensis]CAG9118750.1 unnamed protein product [Bursaphelenchus okinawaensis]